MAVPKTKPKIAEAATPCIRLRGVRQNNLKGFDLDLPLGKLIAITGLSGSGKSSLAFETLYAEGQRRYIETFSPYARQFFDRMDKPAVDRIENIPPAIAIEQRNSVRTTRSTVGTMTEICDHVKTLWPHLSQLYCRSCGRPVRHQPPQQVWDETVAKAAAPAASTQAATPGHDRSAIPADIGNYALNEAVLPYGKSDKEPSGNAEVLITFDLPTTEKLPIAEQLSLLQKQGFQRILLNGRVIRSDEATPALASGAPVLTVISDRVRLTPANRRRFIEAAEQAYHFGQGKLSVWGISTGRADGQSIGQLARYSAGFHCAECDLDYREPSAPLFSFNHPVGACPNCKGFGRIITIDPDLALPDRSKTLAECVVRPWQSGTGAESQNDLMKAAKAKKIPINVPFNQLSPEHQRFVVDGEPDYGSDEEHQWPRAWYGVKGYFRWLETKAYKMHVRVLLSRYRSYKTCPACEGRRFNPDSLLFRLPLTSPLQEALGRVSSDRGNALPPTLSLAEFYALPAASALALVERLERELKPSRTDPLGLLLGEARARLSCLVQVGLGYLTLDRATRTLSGGETERVSLTTCLGTRLVNTLYILDEPSVGLHPRDTAQLVHVLIQLRSLGNTVVVVEHESAVMRAADEIVDIGPGHGESGGRIVFQGPPKALAGAKHSLTADYLTGRKRIEIPERRPVCLSANPPKRGTVISPHLRLDHARIHNLKDLTVELPLARFVCVTGVSGSGKTSLIREVLLPALQDKLGGVDKPAGENDDDDNTGAEGPEGAPGVESVELRGWESLGAVVLVDQSPLGRTPRSNPAVYIGAFEEIRNFFARTDRAKELGLAANAFSFNSAAGQCEKCRGAGFEKIEMQFLSDIYIKCAECQGARYRQHIRDIKISPPGKTSPAWSISDFLDATVDQAVEFLNSFPNSAPALSAARKLALLAEVGLGYLRTGQPINTLSGGESQRLKLVSHLAATDAIKSPRKGKSADAPGSKPSLFLFDEPTTGLHFEDVRILLLVFQRLVDAGHSVLVIEHNMDVIKCADWVLDLGPEAGEAGGEVVAAGTPETIAACKRSHTGRFLKDVLAGP